MASPRLGSPLNEGSGVAVFISKVWQIVENPEYNSLVSWSEVGLCSVSLYVRSTEHAVYLDYVHMFVFVELDLSRAERNLSTIASIN